MFSSFAKAWAAGRNVKVRASVAFPLESSAMGCAGNRRVCSDPPSAAGGSLHGHLHPELGVLLGQCGLMYFPKTLHFQGQQKGLID